MDDKPLISFYVVAYNQEKFIAEAVSGALAQAWSPLEIVLSDDCSDDATFEIMKTMANDYKGSHSIVLNRNERNLGVGAHINRIIQLCKGEWIVASAGDDVSAPERTQRLYEWWTVHGCKAGLVYSNIIEIDEEGAILYERDFQNEVPGGCRGRHLHWDYRERLEMKTPPVHGAAFAYHRRLFDDFGPLWDGVVFEDGVLNWRAEITGGITLCTDYLVRHRNHSKQLTNLYSKTALMDADTRRRMLKWSKIQIRKQNIYDAELALTKGWLNTDTYYTIKSKLEDILKKAELEFKFNWGSFSERWGILLKHFKTIIRERKKNEIIFAVLPRIVYLFALKIKAKKMK